MKNFKYGLIVFDETQQGDMLDILHFVGYWKKPTKKDIESLREELAVDEKFGLTEIVDRLEIQPASKAIVDIMIQNFQEK